MNKTETITNQTTNHASEIAAGERFEFGANWKRFLEVLDEVRIVKAEDALKEMLSVENLNGLTFLDIGSGSGLSSLAARRLGATVRSFDYDPASVACTQELKRLYFKDDPNWQIGEGSALDAAFMRSLGTFDIVYSWGVLHHSGAMWQGLENAVIPLSDGGRLFIAIYNDQGWVSQYWLAVKKLYNMNLIFRWAVTCFHFPYLFAARWLKRALSGGLVIERGMSIWFDMLDWLGGLPFEVASTSAITSYYKTRKLSEQVVKGCGSRHGCNEFVFVRGSQN